MNGSIRDRLRHLENRNSEHRWGALALGMCAATAAILDVTLICWFVLGGSVSELEAVGSPVHRLVTIILSLCLASAVASAVFGIVGIRAARRDTTTAATVVTAAVILGPLGVCLLRWLLPACGARQPDFDFVSAIVGLIYAVIMAVPITLFLIAFLFI